MHAPCPYNSSTVAVQANGLHLSLTGDFENTNMAFAWCRKNGKWVQTELNQLQVSEGSAVCYENGGEDYSMKAFLDEHLLKLPKLIIVTQGFDGGVDLDTLGMDQMMRIACVCKQKRAVAKDESGRTITIPLDYPLLFRPTKQKKKNSQGQRLGDIVAGNTLPVKVEFNCSQSCMFDVGHTRASVRSFGKITISSVYEETYCVANCIHAGVLDRQSILIPLYLQKVLVSTVVGIKDQSYGQFVQFLRDVEIAAKGITHDGKTGNENIAMYNKVDTDKSSSQNIYDTLEPERIYRLAKSQEENSQAYSTLQYATATEHAKKPDEINKSRETTPPTSSPTQAPQLPPRSLIKKDSTKEPLPQSEYEIVNTPDTQPTVPERVRIDPPQRNSSQVKTKGSGPAYVNDIGRAVVSPYQIQTPQKAKQDEKIKVDKLTIDEIGDMLKALKLEKHVKSFKNEKIDGCFIVEFNENILKEEFKFTELETIKLMKFIRTGHIPR